MNSVGALLLLLPAIGTGQTVATTARAYMTITPYDCGSSRGGEARSPRVEVKFQLPERVSIS